LQKQVFLHTGSNLGDRAFNLMRALELVGAFAGEVMAVSSLYRTAPWGKTEQAEFLNQAFEIHTELEPQELLENILAVEKHMGRSRQEKWGPRLIDIDILFFGDKIIKSPELIIPHPHLEERNFVLAPLAEIAPDFLHPLLQKTIRKLLEESPDKSRVERLK
jgi:2-amino-4-hydroxy-6-hydroxymethyldihydropteridine diphosphokinase